MKRAEKRLAEKRARHHLVRGFLTALEDLEPVVAAIRGAPDGPTARTALQKGWSLSQAQAEGVLGLSLRRLTGMALEELRAEGGALATEIADLESLIVDRVRSVACARSLAAF